MSCDSSFADMRGFSLLFDEFFSSYLRIQMLENNYVSASAYRIMT